MLFLFEADNFLSGTCTEHEVANFATTHSHIAYMYSSHGLEIFLPNFIFVIQKGCVHNI